MIQVGLQIGLRAVNVTAIGAQRVAALVARASAQAAQRYWPAFRQAVNEASPLVFRAMYATGRAGAWALRPVAARFLPEDLTNPVEILPTANEVWLPEGTANAGFATRSRGLWVASANAKLRATSVSMAQAGEDGPIRVGGRPSANQKRLRLAATGTVVTVHMGRIRNQAQADRANRIWAELLSTTEHHAARAAAAVASQAVDDRQAASAWEGAIT